MRFLFLLCVARTVLATDPRVRRKRRISEDSAVPPIPDSDSDAIDYYTSDAWASVDPFGQTRFVPAVTIWRKYEERVPVSLFGVSKIHLQAPAISQTRHTAVYALTISPDWVIKYHAYCEDTVEDRVESTLRESYFMNLVYSRFPDVTTRMLYFSRSFTPSHPSRVKLNTRRLLCDTGDAPSVRYMISERVGKTILERVDKEDVIPFTEAIGYAIQIFSLLEKIHSIRVVHGDIHSGNIAVRGSELVLIDFGRGRIGPDSIDALLHEEIEPTHRNSNCHGMYTPWESIKAQSDLSYRDDAFRAALVLAVMIHGDEHREVQGAICGTKPTEDQFLEYHRLKASLNFFDLSVTVGGEVHDFSLARATPGIKPNDRTFIADRLGDLLSYIRSLNYGDLPDYNVIRSSLHAILIVLNN
jgi:serine/threonine protein kinase